jgi:hypothetical protein
VTKNDDVNRRLIFARIGRSEFYQDKEGDEPVEGGRWNTGNKGSESNNFRLIKGQYFGYAQFEAENDPARRQTAIRITGNREASWPLKDVCVIFFAKLEDGGQAVVGWYRHAEMLKERNDRPNSFYGLYRWKCKAADAVLLPARDRKRSIPKGRRGTGQAQVTYARDRLGKPLKHSWIQEVRRYVVGYDGPSMAGPLAGRDLDGKVAETEANCAIEEQGFVPEVKLRQALERYAMHRVGKRLRSKKGARVEDVSRSESYDFEVRRGSRVSRVEVKATRGLGHQVLVSARELKLSLTEQIDLYVVHSIKVKLRNNRLQCYGGKVRVHRDWGARAAKKRPIGWLVELDGNLQRIS